MCRSRRRHRCHRRTPPANFGAPSNGGSLTSQRQPCRGAPNTKRRVHGRPPPDPGALGDGDHSLSALKSIRAARPDGAPIYVIMDNLSANKTPAIRAWAVRNKVELCLTPTSASWADPIEAEFGPLLREKLASGLY